MKKNLPLVLLLAILFLVPFFSFGAAFPRPADNSIALGDIGNILDDIVSIIWEVFAVISVIMFILAGFEFINAQGEPAKINKARQFVIWGVVGIVVAIIGFSIVQTIQTGIGI
jgi:FtsH-binding integral membrane protein